MNLKVAFSPCPNDTYLFHAWVHGLIANNYNVHVTLKDINELNALLLQDDYDVIKGSFAALPDVMDRYFVSPVGSALGYGNGPKIIALKPFHLSELSSKSVAIPGKSTTAYYLMNVLCPPPKSTVVLRYDEILDAILQGHVDAGLIIHETRFLFEKRGCVEIEDLGLLWEKKMGLPLPLGALFIKKTLGKEKIDAIVNNLSESLDYAKKYPNASVEYILKHAQEKEEPVTKKHIETYVTDETKWLSDVGVKAVVSLLKNNKLKDLKNWLYGK